MAFPLVVQLVLAQLSTALVVAVGVAVPLALSASPAAASQSSYSSTVLGDSPTAYWRLGEASGSTGADASGHTHSLAFSAVTLGRPGAPFGDPDTAAGFQSTNVTSSQATATFSSYAPGSFSAELWFRATQGHPVSESSILTASASGGGSSTVVFSLGFDSGGLPVEHVTVGGTSYSQTGSYVVADGGWHQLVATVDGAKVILYVDGQPETSLTVSGTIGWPTSTLWTVGQPSFAEQSAITGDVDEVSLYDTSLTAAAVSTHFNAAGTTTVPQCTSSDAYSAAVCAQGPVGYWRLGESSASQPAADQTSLADNGAYSTGQSSTVGVPGAIGATNTAMTVPTSGLAMEVPYEPYGHYDSSTATLEGWAATSATAPGNLIEQGGTNARWGLLTGSGGVAAAYIRIGSTDYALTSSVVVNDGQWHFLALTYDGSTARLWVDGADVADASHSGRLAACPSCALDVGNPYNCTGCAAAPTAFDEVALFNRALTGAQIRATAALVGPTSANLIGGGDPSSGYQPCQCADPVDAATGSLNETTPAFTKSGRGPLLSFFATYDSSQVAAAVGRLGRAWVDPYQMTVKTTSTGAVVTQENGSQIAFVAVSGGYQAPSRSQVTLAHNGDNTWTFVRDNSVTFDFTTGGFLHDVKDLNGNTTTLSYTGSPSLTSLTTITDAVGRTFTLTYNTSHRVSKVADGSGQTMLFTYSSGNLTSVTDPEGRVTTYGYGPSNLLTTVQDARGHTTTNGYDSSGRVISQTDRRGKTTTFDYSTPGTTTITDPLGNLTKLTFDQNLLMSQTLGAGSPAATTTKFDYDPTSLGITSVVDGNNHTWSATYDANGNKVSQTDPTGDSQSWTYNGFNEPLTHTDANQNTTTYTYDGNGNLTTVSTPIDASTTALTTYRYDDPANPGSLTSVVDPNGNTTTFAYNGYDELTSTVDPVGDTTTYTYTCAGCRAHLGVPYTMVAPKGNVAGATASDYTTSYTYNDDLQLLSTTDPRGATTNYSYDANGNLTSASDRLAHVTGYSYNANDQLMTTTYPDQSTATNTYDADGNRSSLVDGRGNTTAFAYDPLNRLQSVTTPGTTTRPGGVVTGYTYDSAGNLATMTQPATGGGTLTTSYTYTHANRLATISYGDATTPDVAYTYDGVGNPLTMTDGTGTTHYTYNLAGWPTHVVDGAGQDVRYGYDPAGNATTITYPNGQMLTRSFDAEERLASITDWNSATTSFAYSPDNTLKTITYPNSVIETRSYNRDDAVSQVSDTLGGPTLASYAYTLDNNQNLSAIAGSGANPGPTVSATHNSLQQLASYNGTANLAYDPAGNITKLDTGRSFTYDNANELSTSVAGGVTTTYGFNDRGLRTSSSTAAGSQTYGYDQANRLTRYTNPATTATYTFDGNGLRTSKTVNGTTTGYTWDSATAAVPLLLSDGTTSYLYGPDGLPVEQVTTNGATYLGHDDQGSTRLLTDQAGTVTGVYTYGAYGQTLSHTGTATTPLRYTGQYQDDESGLYNLRARNYDPSTAQFLTRDPLEATTHQPYGYAGNNPTNNTDPTGLWCLLGTNTDGSCHGGTAYDNAVMRFDPAYLAVAGYANEWDAAEHGCSTLTIAKYAAQAVTGVALTAFAAIGGLATEGAAQSESGLVNLATDARTTHILEGDGTGGGHLWPGAAGKTPFPQSWSGGQIMHAISDIATDPAAWENAVQQGSRTVLVGTRDGVEIRVIVGGDGEIITGYPINLPRNP